MFARDMYQVYEIDWLINLLWLRMLTSKSDNKTIGENIP